MGIENNEATFKLQDRTAIISGPCNSINQSIASKLTQLGANVALIDRNIEKTQRFAAQLMDMREINERYGRATAIQADLSKPHHVQDAVSRAAEAFGGIDIYIDGLVSTEVSPFREPAIMEEFERMIDVNLRAPLLMTHSVLRFLEGRKRGRIIYLMHDLGRMGIVNNSLLALTRTGLTPFSRTLSRELADKNITVNCVAMGATEDFLLSQHKNETVSIQEAHARLTKQFPQAMMTEPDRVANTVAFLASPLGIGITGQTIAVSQGLSFL